MRFPAENFSGLADSECMKNAYFVILVLLFLSLAMGACVAVGESGFWRGTGTYHDDRGTRLVCGRLEASFHRTEHRLSISEVRTECGEKYWAWGPSEFEVRGDRLFRGGEKVGEIFPQGGGWIHLEDPYQKLSFYVRWEVEGDKMQYTEEVFTPNVSYRIHGDLYR